MNKFLNTGLTRKWNLTGHNSPGTYQAFGLPRVILAALLVIVLTAGCQNPFSRPVPDSVDLSFNITIGSTAARSLSHPVDFSGRRLTVRLHASDSGGLPGPVLSTFSTLLPEPLATTTTLLVPVTFNAVPTRMDLVLTGSLADTDPANTVYYTAGSAVFQAGLTDANVITLPFSKVVFPLDAKLISSFGFRKSLNAGLAQDYSAVISGTTISLVLPEGTDPLILKSLIPTFAHTGKTVAVGGSSQLSSVSVQDFSSPGGLNYTVAAVDGSTQTYTVNLSVSGNTPGLSVTISLANPLDPAISLSGAQAILSRSGSGFPAVMTVTADAGFISYIWLLNGETIDPAMVATSNQALVTADVVGSELFFGAHNLTLLVTDGDLVEHSIPFSFQVQE